MVMIILRGYRLLLSEVPTWLSPFYNSISRVNTRFLSSGKQPQSSVVLLYACMKVRVVGVGVCVCISITVL